MYVIFILDPTNLPKQLLLLANRWTARRKNWLFLMHRYLLAHWIVCVYVIAYVILSPSKINQNDKYSVCIPPRLLGYIDSDGRR